MTKEVISALNNTKNLLLILKLLQQSIVLTDSLPLLILKLDVEVISFSIDATIEVLIVICKFLLLIFFHPLVNLVLFVLGFASLGLEGFVASGFEDQGSSLERGEDVLA